MKLQRSIVGGASPSLALALLWSVAGQVLDPLDLHKW